MSPSYISVVSLDMTNVTIIYRCGNTGHVTIYIGVVTLDMTNVTIIYKCGNTGHD